MFILNVAEAGIYNQMYGCECITVPNTSKSMDEIVRHH